jgi:hypothetical protein
MTRNKRFFTKFTAFAAVLIILPTVSFAADEDAELTPLWERTPVLWSEFDPPDVPAYNPGWADKLYNAGLSLALNGREIAFTGQRPLISGGESLIPVSEVFRNLGFTSEWNGATRTTTLKGRKTTLTITDGSYSYTVGGFERSFGGASARIINGCLMAPFEAILDSVGVRAYLDVNGVIHLQATL